MHWNAERAGAVWHDACARRLGLVEDRDEKPKRKPRRPGRPAPRPGAG